MIRRISVFSPRATSLHRPAEEENLSAACMEKVRMPILPLWQAHSRVSSHLDGVAENLPQLRYFLEAMRLLGI
jgi:hypothetical protein